MVPIHWLYYALLLPTVTGTPGVIGFGGKASRNMEKIEAVVS